LIYGRAVNAGGSEDDHPARFAVLYLDLDRFKALNDTAGHTAGDAFLAEVGERIAAELQDHGFLGRISGDEFMIAVEGLEEAKVKDLAERIVERIAEPFAFGSHNLTVGASIGIANYPEAGHSADQLLQNADTAMYFAKRAGRYCVRLYTREMAQIDADKLLIFHELRNAISLKQLQLFYQPKFDLHTGTLAGSEALLRWNHPTRGLLGPMAFIGVAEESALILEIGSWVLREACRQFAAWRDEGIARRLPRIDINLSARQLVDPRFPDAVSDALSIHGLSANNIGLEITESMLTEDMDQAAKVLEGFRSMGMSVALDDFGTGYSNLSYIQRFPITTLKVDKSFVQQVETSENSRALVNGIISMARALKLLVVAEGVETYTQLEFLIAQQCDAIQGYIVSPAVPAHTFREKFLLATPPLNILNMREVS
jgi:diguanylate cyclase (GGDEF)-like protein